MPHLRTSALGSILLLVFCGSSAGQGSSPVGNIVHLHREITGIFNPKCQVAHDPVTGQSLVVWDDRNLDAAARGLTPEGQALSPAFRAIRGYHPAVAAVRGPGSVFAVAALGLGGVSVVATTAATVVGMPVTVALAPGAESPAVAGSPGDDHAIVAWVDTKDARLRVAKFSMTTMSTVQVIVLAGVLVSPTFGFVRISPDGGATGRYLVVWEQRVGKLIGSVIDRNLEVLTPPFAIAANSLSEGLPSVAGDGTSWLVASQREEFKNSLDADVVCRRVVLDPATGDVQVSPETVIAGTPGVSEGWPSVTLADDTYTVAYALEFSSFPNLDFDLWVTTVSKHGCQPCVGPYKVTASTGQDQNSGVAAGSNGRILLAWLSEELPNVTTRACLFAPNDGTVLDLGGGCGGGGRASASCAAVGGVFALQTGGAARSAAASLLLGATAIAAPCGPCILTTTPIVAVPGMTDAFGNAQLEFTLSEPALIGGSLAAQWLVAAPEGCGSFSLSNGLLVTIE